MKLRLSDHVVEDFERFGLLAVLDTSPFRHFDVHVRNTYWKAGRRHSTAKVKMVSVKESGEKT